MDHSHQRLQEGVIDRSYTRARLVNAALGAWLILSTFIWHDFELARRNAWLTGTLILVSSLAALRVSMFRRVNSAVAVWLFASSFFIIRPIDIRSLCNNLMVAALVLMFSLVSRGGGDLAPPLSERERRG